VGAELLAHKILGVIAFFAVVELEDVIAAANDCQLAAVVKVEGVDELLGILCGEALRCGQ
jgi:hypothetical protein